MNEETILVHTKLFNYTEVKEHFINEGCFGEDFAGWLKGALSSLAREGFSLSEIIQEDYGWGLWIERERSKYWLAVSYAPEGLFDEDYPTDAEGDWYVHLNYDPGLNLISRLFHKPNAATFELVRDHLLATLRAREGITIKSRC